jgi:hypothetical protein
MIIVIKKKQQIIPFARQQNNKKKLKADGAAHDPENVKKLLLYEKTSSIHI